jgi:hypothetical protein
VHFASRFADGRRRRRHAPPARASLGLPGDEDTENVPRILPNTRVLTAGFTIR